MHAFFASLHMPVSLGIALMALIYVLKVMAGYLLFARFRQWRASRRSAKG